MEFHFRCKVCPHEESWTTHDAMLAASLNHLSETHPDMYTKLVDTDVPEKPEPEMYGRKLNRWESQAEWRSN